MFGKKTKSMVGLQEEFVQSAKEIKSNNTKLKLESIVKQKKLENKLKVEKTMESFADVETTQADIFIDNVKSMFSKKVI